MNLANLLKLPARRVVTARLVSAVAKSKYVNPEATIPLGIVKKLDPEVFPPDSRPVAIRREVSKQRDFTAWILAFLSKNPHYKYLQTTLSGWSPGRKYWFLDTALNKKVVYTYDEISRGIVEKIAIDTSHFEIVEQPEVIPMKLDYDDLMWYGRMKMRVFYKNKWDSIVTLVELQNQVKL